MENLGHVIRPGKLEVDNVHTTSLRQAKNPHPKVNFVPSCVCVTSTDSSSRTLHAYHIRQINSPHRSSGQVQMRQKSTDILQHTNREGFFPLSFTLPKRKLPYSLYTDASSYSIDCNLFHTYGEWKDKSIGYWSPTLNAADQTYSNH